MWSRTCQCDSSVKTVLELRLCAQRFVTEIFFPSPLLVARFIILSSYSLCLSAVKIYCFLVGTFAYSSSLLASAPTLLCLYIPFTVPHPHVPLLQQVQCAGWLWIWEIDWWMQHDSAVQACIPFRAFISLHKGCEPMSDLSICARNLNAACGVSVRIRNVIIKQQIDVGLTVHRSSMWNKKPTRCHLVLYLFLLYKLLNMFRATLCPSSGADDLVVFLPHVV